MWVPPLGDHHPSASVRTPSVCTVCRCRLPEIFFARWVNCPYFASFSTARSGSEGELHRCSTCARHAIIRRSTVVEHDRDMRIPKLLRCDGRARQWYRSCDERHDFHMLTLELTRVRVRCIQDSTSIGFATDRASKMTLMLSV